MPRGVFIDVQLRQQLFHNLITLDESAKVVFAKVLSCNENVVSLNGLANLKSKLKAMSADEVQMYLSGPTSRRVAGRKRKFGPEVREAVSEIRLNSCLTKLSTVVSTYKHYYLGEDNVDVEAPSVATVSRMLRKDDIVRKVVERRHIGADLHRQELYLETVAPLDPDNFIDIDESCCNDAQFLQKYGWARRGENAYGTQFTISNHNYSVIAAYSTRGFIAWNVYENSGTAREFMHFLNMHLRGFMQEEQVVILDNCSIHKTEEARAQLEDICSGNYMFVPPYSPTLKPIELGFANCKSYLREREARCVQDPVALINEAFQYYAVDGVKSSAGISIFIVLLIVLVIAHLIVL